MQKDDRAPHEPFLDRFGRTIARRRIRIGCSFAPEQFPTTDYDGGRFALTALRTAVEEYGVADVRLGLRWNRLAPDGRELSSYYDPFMDYCFETTAVRSVCLDLGPIKTFRWPEVHIPESVLAVLGSLPVPGAVIEPASELAAVSFRHFERALRYVGERYDGRTEISFCFNEVFHSFGHFGWTMSDDYVATLIRMVEASGRFPGAGFVINSAGGLQLDRIARFYAERVRASPELRGRLTSGYDLYPFLPSPTGIPILHQALDLARGGWRRFAGSAGRNIRCANEPETGYRIEVTEAQTEPWGVQQTVGNSLPYYQRVLAESIGRILNPDQEDSVIRMWGIEYQLERVLTGSAIPANREILDLTRRVNELATRGTVGA